MTTPEPVEPTFRRIAIVNRGECAMRLIRAVHELNRERDLGLTTIALFTEPERRAHLRAVHDVVVRALGPRAVRGVGGRA